MSIFIPILESLCFGFLTASAVYTISMVLVCLLLGRQLVSGESTTAAYSVLLTGIWLVASFAGGYVAFALAPFAPLGPWIFSYLVAAFVIATLSRNRREYPQQQSPAMLFTLCTVVLLGCTAGAMLHARRG